MKYIPRRRAPGEHRIFKESVMKKETILDRERGGMAVEERVAAGRLLHDQAVGRMVINLLKRQAKVQVPRRSTGVAGHGLGYSS